MLLRKLEIKDFVAKEYHNCKRSSTRKIHDSLKYMCHDLSEEAIQNLLNQDRSLTQRNTNFSNKSSLTTHKSKIRPSMKLDSLMTRKLKELSLLKANNVDTPSPLRMFSVALFGFIR